MSCLPLSAELVALTTRFTDQLMSQGLTTRILSLVSEISVTREFERLQKQCGLGNEKHRKEVREKTHPNPDQSDPATSPVTTPPYLPLRPPTGIGPHQGVPGLSRRVSVLLDLPITPEQGRHPGPDWLPGDGDA